MGTVGLVQVDLSGILSIVKFGAFVTTTQILSICKEEKTHVDPHIDSQP
jgi:hypothetical protein